MESYEEIKFKKLKLKIKKIKKTFYCGDMVT